MLAGINAALQTQDPELRDAQLRALDQLDAARRSGIVTEAEFQKRRRLVLEGKLEEAGQALKQAIALREPLARKNPQVVAFQLDLGREHANLGNLHYTWLVRRLDPDRAGRFVLAKSAFDKALAIHERLAKDYPDERRFLVEEGMTLSAIGNLIFDDSVADAAPWPQARDAFTDVQDTGAGPWT